jgi:hypothetical protein
MKPSYCPTGKAPQEPRQLDVSFVVDELPDARVAQDTSKPPPTWEIREGSSDPGCPW